MIHLPRDAVKTRRPYDSSGRRAAAQRRREKVLDSAWARCSTDGYAATTVAAIAAEAEVSSEMVYKAFGGKPGLIRALWDRALAGAGPVPAEQRSDAVSSTAEDPLLVFDTWARLSAEVAPRGAPVQLLVRAAAASDPAVALLYEELEAARLRRMAHNANSIRRHLRPGLSVQAARDVLFALTGASLYEPLVMRQGWTLEAYADFIRRSLVAQLLD
jgi:AcrR family transcriptional regulator